MTTPGDETVKMLHDLRNAMTGISNSLDLLTVHLLSGQTCDTSMQTPYGYMGPCTLRVQHGGPLHRDAKQQVWSESTPAEYYDPDQQYPTQEDLEQMSRDNVPTVPLQRPAGWFDCNPEYLAEMNLQDCSVIPRMPSEAPVPIDVEIGSVEAPHMHPLQFRVGNAQRALNGCWTLSDGVEGTLEPRFQLENSELIMWWRHYGVRR